MTFRQIVSNYLKNSNITVNPKYDCCPDKIFGVLIKGVVAEHRLGIEKRNKQKPAIILVLESPHTHEFEGKIEPAKGKTGNNIKDFLITFDTVGLPTHNSYIILINAVRYQCSLGDRDTQNYRDDIFTAVWKDFGQQCFIERLYEIYQEGDYVINACTKGNKDISKNNELRRLVETAIEKVKDNGSDLQTLHPSTWDNPTYENCNWCWKK
jgi:hypothetical protein